MKFTLIFLLLTARVFAALASTTVWQIQTASLSSAPSVNNGGGFNPSNASPGTDYSTNTGGYNLTDLASTSGTTNPSVITSATHNFVAADQGNIIHITAGTNWTAGFYEIVSCAGNAATLDRAAGTSATISSGTGHVGDPLAAIGNIGSNTAGLGAVAGNKIWVKADGAYSLGATDTFAVVATAANPIVIEGYLTTRGDGYLGRNVTTNQELITTNFPNYQYQASFRLIATNSSFCIWRNLNISIAGSGTSGTLVGNLGADSVMTRCVLTNPSTNTSAGGANVGARAIFLDNDIFMTGASGGASSTGLAVTSLSSRAIANRVQMSASTSTGPAVSASSSAVILHNTVIGNGGIQGIAMVGSTGAPTIFGNTIVGFVDGADIVTGTTGLQCVIDNIITDNSGNAIDAVDAGSPVFNAYNRLRGVTTVNGATNFTTASSDGNVTTAGAAYSDYVSQAGGDYRLLADSPAVSTAIPAAASMGALQRNQTGTGQTSYSQ